MFKPNVFTSIQPHETIQQYTLPRNEEIIEFGTGCRTWLSMQLPLNGNGV